MRISKFTIAGSAVFAAGMLVIGMALSVGGNFASTALAGQVASCAPTATLVADSVQVAPSCTPTTVVKAKTHTPTTSPTAAATSTPVPATPAPPNTPAPPAAATATKAGGGVGAGGVTPPNTGAGGSGGGSMEFALIAAGAVLAALGGGSVLVGVRRRS